MRSVTVKLILAFLVISLVSILLFALVAHWTTGREFENFIFDQNLTGVEEVLAQYYQENGGWEGLDQAQLSIQDPVPGSVAEEATPPDTSGGQPAPPPPYTVVDVDRRVVLAGPGRQMGQVVAWRDFEAGIPISVDGEEVGRLLILREAFGEDPNAAAAMRDVRRIFVFGGLATAVISLTIGIVMSRSLTRPVRELTAATRAVARGNLGQRVSVRSRDEVGELAKSFNEMSAELENSTRLRRQMTADIAHELRTPLSLIIGHADAVCDGVQPASVENFEIIREEALRLEHLVEDLRTLSLADSGELSMDIQEVAPEKLVRKIAADYQVRLGQKKLGLFLHFDPDLPNFRVDPDRLTQVVSNILDNAIRHTPENGQIAIAVRRVDEMVEIAVQDSGPGVPKESLQRIFDRMYRVEPSRQRGDGGTGLGLSIARSIVELFGGRIWAENAADHGLRLIISLPAKI